MNDYSENMRTFEQLVRILDMLRSDGGCPWDREQDEKSIVNFFLEEVYEAVDAVMADDVQALKEELGDVLMEVVFLARIYSEKKKFTIYDVLEGINRKMIGRHPHVFGTDKIETSAKVVDVWNKRKKAEKKRSSILDGMASFEPSLLKAFQIGQRVSAVGFDWETTEDVMNKVREELGELENALRSDQPEDAAEEIGDLLFSLVNVSRHLDLNPEIALRKTNEKFCSRFRYVEKKVGERGEEWGKIGLEKLDALWEEAKLKEKSKKD